MKLVIFFILSLMVLLFIIPTTVNAGCGDSPGDASGAVELCSPIDVNSPQELVGKVISGILSIVGSLALAMFVYGGLVWMTASGSPEKVQKGKNILVWAAIGLAVVFSAYALVAFVLKGLGIE